MGVELIVWTNNACSKSRTAEQLLTEQGIAFTTRRYLEDPPSRAELEDVLRKLGTDDPRAIARPGVTGDDVLDQLSRDPSLIERPIAIRGDRAVVARPPEKVLEI
ncbi:MAG: arsenate reductase [Frankiales bacterium]|nr:arsenate reductase [Frankiales bacterium]